MSSETFSYAGKLAEELFLLICGIGLSFFMVYELFFSNDILTINGVYLGPLFSRMAMITLLILALALTIVTLANLNNRKHKFIEIATSHLLIPKRFSKRTSVISLSSIENIERKDYNGTEMISFKIRGKLGRVSLESSKFQSKSQYTSFLKSLEKAIGQL